MSKNQAAVELGRRGAAARARNLSPARVLEIARIASAAAKAKRDRERPVEPRETTIRPEMSREEAAAVVAGRKADAPTVG